METRKWSEEPDGVNCRPEWAGGGYAFCEEVLSGVTAAAGQILGQALTGVYLHGSLAMGCFNPDRSDIDLILVINREMTDRKKRLFMEEVVKWNCRAPQKGLELSVVREEFCRNFVYPTPFELHFSPVHLKWWQEDPMGYIRGMKGTDPDLAAHFTILRKYGITLAGEAVEEVFGEVPREAYLDSIRRDVENALEDVCKEPVYIILNLCRVAAFVREERILSKAAGGEWGLSRLPEKYHKIIRDALAAYQWDEAKVFDPILAREFCREVLTLIHSDGERYS